MTITFPPKQNRDRVLHRIAKVRQALVELREELESIEKQGKGLPESFYDVWNKYQYIAALTARMAGDADTLPHEPLLLGREAPVQCYAYHVASVYGNTVFRWIGTNGENHIHSIPEDPDCDWKLFPKFRVVPPPQGWRVNWNEDSRSYEFVAGFPRP